MRNERVEVGVVTDSGDSVYLSSRAFSDQILFTRDSLNPSPSAKVYLRQGKASIYKLSAVCTSRDPDRGPASPADRAAGQGGEGLRTSLHGERGRVERPLGTGRRHH